MNLAVNPPPLISFLFQLRAQPHGRPSLVGLDSPNTMIFRSLRTSTPGRLVLDSATFENLSPDSAVLQGLEAMAFMRPGKAPASAHKTHLAISLLNALGLVTRMSEDTGCRQFLGPKSEAQSRSSGELQC